MTTINKLLKKNWLYVAAFAIPLCVALLYCIVEGLWITGKGNIAVGDLMTQIIPIAYELWDKVHLHESMSFTWHAMDGIDFSTLTGYLASPFTIVMLLLPRAWIANYMQFIMLIKWSLVSLSMTYFFCNTKHNSLNEHKELVSLFLGLSYTLGNGIMSYILYVQFMDVMICFPILLLLIEKMVDNGNWKLYYIILTFVIFSNSYIAFQICIFLIFWFLLQIIDDKAIYKTKKFLIFAGSSALAGLTNCAFIINGLKNSTGRLNMDVSSQMKYFESGMIVKPYDFIKQLFMFNYIQGPSDKLPNIYFSVVALVVVILFPALRIDKKKKIYMCCVTILLAAGFFIGKLNLFWHIFTPPNGVYNRFMYLFVFFMLFLTLYVFNSIEEVHFNHLIIAVVVLLIVFGYTYYFAANSGSVVIFAGTITVIVLTILMLIFYKRDTISKNNIILLISLMGILELCFNSYHAFISFHNDTYFGKDGYIDQAVEMLDDIGISNGERITAAIPTPNIGMITGNNSDAGFISAVNSSNYFLHEQLGMAINSKTVFLSRGASPVVNIIYNIRYGLGESDLIFSDSKIVSKGDNFNLYQIDRLAGLGYIVDETVKEWDINSGNCFDVQNDFVKKSVGIDNVFTKLDLDVVCKDSFDVEYEPEYDSENDSIDYNFVGEYGDSYDAKQFDFVVDKDMDLYMHYSCNKRFRIVIMVDGEQLHVDADAFRESTYHIGEIEKGCKVTVIAVPMSAVNIGEEYTMSFIFAEFDNSLFDSAYEQFNRNIYNITDEKSNYIKGDINVDAPGIMMTSIPALNGFDVYIDGTETKYSVIGDTFIGIPLEKGKHVVEFVYKNALNVVFYIISMVSFLIFIIICIMEKVKFNKFVEKENADE